MTNPLVGRRAEVSAVAQLLDSADGQPAALILEGEPGIGKTTLWLDGVRRARSDGARVLSARASAAESVLGYATLADLLAEVDREVWADLPTPQRQGLEAALLSEHETPQPAVDQRAVGSALLTVLRRLAVESRVVVAIDDLQWIDGSSAAAIAFAARRLSERVVWLCTARSDAPSVTETWQLDRPDAIRRIQLTPLAAGELHDVLVAHLGHPFARPTTLRIQHASGGNPFYALELARGFNDTGVAADLKLPDSLAELTRARIIRVGTDAAEALLAIASLAAPTLRLVADATGVPPRRLLEQLSPAEIHGIVTIEDDRIRFAHPLLAHAVRSGATAPQRRSMHRRLAEVVIEPELRARHLAIADPSGEPETLAALDAGADIARGRGAPAAAAELLELAIGRGGATGERRMRLAQCLFASGDPRRAREALEKAVDEMAPGPERAEATQQLALVRLYDDGFTEAAELGRRALQDCAEQTALRVSILTMLAFAELNTGRSDSALLTAEQAVDTAERLGMPEPLGRALGMRAIMQFMNGKGVSAADLRRVAALDIPDSHVPVALRPSVQSALLLGWTGELAQARDTLARIGRRCAALGEEGEMMFIAFQLVTFDIWLGDFATASQTADEAIDRARHLGGDAAMFLALTVRGTVASYQGRIDEARNDLADAITAGAGSNYVLMTTWTIAMMGFVELSLGDYAKALAAIEPLMPMVRNLPQYTEILGTSFVPDAAEAMIGVGRLDEAELLVEALERNGNRLDRPWILAVGARCRALLSAARGDVAGGVEHARAALTHHDRIPMPVERGRSLLVLGRLERRLRHWRPATAALSEALAIFEDVGAPLWAAQVRVELDRKAVGRPRSHGLTPTEQRVAQLAASGKNNQDIAADLFVARKTVEVNLSRIYRKLGIHSRIELYHVMNGAISDPAAQSGNKLR